MKKILLFSFLFIIIPVLSIFLLIVEPNNYKFSFSKNTVVRIYRSKTGKIDIVPLEKYIIGVVSGEMPISFQDEALKAQAVAARSYIMYKILNSKKKKYDVVDTVLNQVYLDDTQLKKKWGKKYENNINKVRDAVNATAYEYITYDNKIANALFFSTSSGFTENSEEVFSSKVHYLRSVKSEWDNISPTFQQHIDYDYVYFCKMLQIPYTKSIDIKVISQTSAGKINKISINNKMFTGEEIVKIFNLKSRNFTITLDDKIKITTRGFGHGVGMSQYGAEGMARAGYKYDEILKYYYKDIEIKKIK